MVYKQASSTLFLIGYEMKLWTKNIPGIPVKTIYSIKFEPLNKKKVSSLNLFPNRIVALIESIGMCLL